MNTAEIIAVKYNASVAFSDVPYSKHLERRENSWSGRSGNYFALIARQELRANSLGTMIIFSHNTSILP